MSCNRRRHSLIRHKAEYERLEKELEELDTKIQEARTQASENALKKQQLENSVELLKEQIRAAQQNHQHYEERIADDLSGT